MTTADGRFEEIPVDEASAWLHNVQCKPRWALPSGAGLRKPLPRLGPDMATGVSRANSPHADWFIWFSRLAGTAIGERVQAAADGLSNAPASGIFALNQGGKIGASMVSSFFTHAGGHALATGELLRDGHPSPALTCLRSSLEASLWIEWLTGDFNAEGFMQRVAMLYFHSIDRGSRWTFVPDPELVQHQRDRMLHWLEERGWQPLRTRGGELAPPPKPNELFDQSELATAKLRRVYNQLSALAHAEPWRVAMAMGARDNQAMITDALRFGATVWLMGVDRTWAFFDGSYLDHQPWFTTGVDQATVLFDLLPVQTNKYLPPGRS